MQAHTCDCSATTTCELADEDDGDGLDDSKFPGGGFAGLSKREWGAWGPVTMTPRIGCTDTVTHAYETEHIEHRPDGTGHVVSPVNRFYGSEMFAPTGPGMSIPGTLPLLDLIQPRLIARASHLINACCLYLFPSYSSKMQGINQRKRQTLCAQHPPKATLWVWVGRARTRVHTCLVTSDNASRYPARWRYQPLTVLGQCA